jgi:hypothetical protein
VGVRRYTVAGGIAKPVIAPVLGTAVEDRWGILEGSPVARRLRLAAPITDRRAALLEEREAGVVPSVPLRTIMHVQAHQRGNAPLTVAIDSEHDLIRMRDREGLAVKSIPVVDSDMNMIVAVASREDLSAAAFHEVYANADHPERLARFEGKVVVIGYTSPDDRWNISAGNAEPRYGVELQASAISNLLRGVYIKPLAASGQYLVIVIMGTIGALLRRGSSMRRRVSIPVRIRSVATTTLHVPVLLIAALVVYALAAFLVYKQYRIILDISYHIASALFVYAVLGRVLRGGTENALPKRA